MTKAKGAKASQLPGTKMVRSRPTERHSTLELFHLSSRYQFCCLELLGRALNCLCSINSERYPWERRGQLLASKELDVSTAVAHGDTCA